MTGIRWTAGTFTLLMGACSVAHAAELDRATALSLIRNTGLEPYTFEVPIGNEVNLQILLPTVVRQDATWGNQLNVAYKCLNDLGYLTITKNPRHPLGAYIVATTNKSGTAGKVLNTLLLGYASKYVFQLADRIPERISGIKKTGMDSATVLFEWKLGNHSELYKCMFIPEDTLTTGVAGLAKYDNGWRVENVDLFKK